MGIIYYFKGLDLQLKLMAKENLKEAVFRLDFQCITRKKLALQQETMNGILPTTLIEIQGPHCSRGKPKLDEKYSIGP